MKVLKGTSAASGIAQGVVCLYTSEAEKAVPHYTVEPEGLPAEIDRFVLALERSRKEMQRMIHVAEKRGDGKAVDIFTAHLMILNDGSLSRQIIALIKKRLINAEHAVSDVFESSIRRYEKQEGHFRELTHDFIDTRDRILNGFMIRTGQFKCAIGESRPVIAAAVRLTPSMVLTLSKKNALAFITKEGGMTSHAMILARSYSVPIIFGIDVEQELDCGMKAIVDANAGKVIVGPDASTAEYYARRIASLERKKRVCIVKKDEAARTRGGGRVLLKLNVSTPAEMELVREFPHDGIGLLRTEFLFTERAAPPHEDEQYRMYREILLQDRDKPATVRLLDVAADKLPLFLTLPQGMNPDMELRGALAVETFPELYIDQVKALLRANEAGNLRLLYPMVADTGDLRTFRSIVREARARLRREKAVFNDVPVKEGVMVETPAAVILLDEILAEVDFVNIGSNDLLQYTLAASRSNALAEKRYHILHPSLVRFLMLAARAGKKAKKEVCLCGEVASFGEFYPLLLATGLGSFSVATSKFSDIKCELLHMSGGGNRTLVKDFFATRSKEEEDRFFAKFL